MPLAFLVFEDWEPLCLFLRDSINDGLSILHVLWLGTECHECLHLELHLSDFYIFIDELQRDLLAEILLVVNVGLEGELEVLLVEAE